MAPSFCDHSSFQDLQVTIKKLRNDLARFQFCVFSTEKNVATLQTIFGYS